MQVGMFQHITNIRVEHQRGPLRSFIISNLNHTQINYITIRSFPNIRNFIIH